MGGSWDDTSVFPLAFVAGAICGGVVYVLLKRRLYARLEPRQRVRIGANGLFGSALVVFVLLCIRPDLPASFACAAFLWGVSGLFFMLLCVSDKSDPSEIGIWHRLIAPRVETRDNESPTIQGPQNKG